MNALESANSRASRGACWLIALRLTDNNKVARTVWALMAHGGTYRAAAPAV